MSKILQSRFLSLTTLIVLLLILWIGLTFKMNSQIIIDNYEENEEEWTTSQVLEEAWSMNRPLVPSPEQVILDLNKSIFQKKITSKRSLIYHSWVTLSSTLVGFFMGLVLGVILAIGIVNVKTLERSLLPWIIASQTIPILAIAPMIIVVLGAVGLSGLVPKAIISAYLSFFPITIGMVKGLRSPDPLQIDLIRTYSASSSQTFWKLRWPSATPFLFTSLKVAIASSLVGAIVGELPTGAQAGIGARLLSGSYYGQTVQIWSALIVASILAGSLVFAVGALEKLILGKMGVAKS